MNDTDNRVIVYNCDQAPVTSLATTMATSDILDASLDALLLSIGEFKRGRASMDVLEASINLTRTVLDEYGHKER